MMHDTDASPPPRTPPKPHKNRRDSSLLAITVDADTARILRVEGIDARGTRHELSSDERERLLRQPADRGMDDLVERAFEAGIACVLADGKPSASDDESPEDAALRHELLAPLIDRSGVRHLLEGAALDRAMLTTLIDHAAD